ncbi:MAG: phosphoribosyl-ATP diphosphatase [Clostridiales Family XIII bacterium]|nr:phosphoribosyl-ATP diphosphatase [Clostridiales Family XIII bacterium]
MRQLNHTILARKANSEEGSYTGYLFREGIDKILKKVGEECSETIIASKSLEADSNDTQKKTDLENEICDLIYHLLVLMAAQNIPLSDIESILQERAKKTSNKKSSKIIDKNS